MKQTNLFDPVPKHRLESFSKEELIEFFELQQKVIDTIIKDNERLRAKNNELQQRSLLIADQYVTIKNKLFGKSSERSRSSRKLSNKPKKRKIQLPSERYPNLPLIERHITLDKMPSCKCCGHEMEDSGMTEDSEYLTKIPAQFYVVVQMRHKYRCGKCHADIQVTPSQPRIKPGSSYSDEMIIDTAVSKYCDLIPIERQVKIAKRLGVDGLPQQSLIESTHYLAEFTMGVYQKLKTETCAPIVMNADETTHRMLEGDEKSGWYLWGFSTPRSCFFECHDTRSGDVASEVLLSSKAEYLVSDVYSGYAKAVKEANKVRKEKNLPQILNVYCNAHARRYFKESEERFPAETKFYTGQYRKIYRLEGLVKKNPELSLKIRARMKKYFEKMKAKAMADVGGYSLKSGLGKAMNYLLKNYDGLTVFLKLADLPIDNNSQERLLRNPVIGRKTWYGTHSKRGAETAAVLFSIVESCKLNDVNPREFFKMLVDDLHQGLEAFTPYEYKNKLQSPQNENQK